MSTLPAEFLDPGTPPDVIVTDTAPPPITDPTLGVALGTPPPGATAPPANPTHALVTIGDSLTHGVSSGAVFRTDLSWPALVARRLAISDFAFPAYGGPLDGLPLNAETLLRRLQDTFGTSLGVFDKVRLPFTARRLLDRNEDYWERGDGHLPPPTAVKYHNIGIYGWDVRDAMSYDSARATEVASAKVGDDFGNVKPENDNAIAAASVLAPFGRPATQVGAAKWFGDNGGIETLVVALGSNNALGAVVSKKVRWSAGDFGDLELKRQYNVWRPTHFDSEFDALVTGLRTIPARRVIVATVPHVTIAPIAKGVNPDNHGQKWRPGSRYFPYYTDPWVAEGGFRPNRHRKLTHQQARAIDSAIDQYNDTICNAVRAARHDGRDWQIVDLCGLLDGLAERRFKLDADAAARNDWVEVALPAPIEDLDSRFFRSDAGGRREGGLFGLDGIHPTTSAYGVVAQAVLDVIDPAKTAATRIDFAELRASDTLNREPPALVNEILGLVRWATPFLGGLRPDPA